jgi:hypothetical protein
MFEPRPVEGDPLTGDTRDGGENARLANLERKIADGRANEGDEESLRRGVQNKQSRARPPAADRGENDADGAGEQDRGEVQEGDDQHPEGEDGGTDPEGTPEQDPDEQKFEVTVDGQAQEVTLSEDLRGYIREQTLYQRMNKVNEARQAVDLEAHTIAQHRDAYIQRLQYVDRMMAEFTPPEPNWDAEFQANPQAAYAKQKAYAEIYQKRAAIDAEVKRTAQEQQEQYNQRSQKYAVDEFAKFVRKAKIQDEKQLTERMSAMKEYGRSVGFSEQELGSTYDERMLTVLDEAAQNWTARRDRPKPVIPGQGKTLVPGVPTPIGQGTRRSLDADQSRLAKSGKLDDAALVFRHFIR